MHEVWIWCYLIIIFAWSLGCFFCKWPLPSIHHFGWRQARPSKAPWRCFGWIFAAWFLRDFLVEATNFRRKHTWKHTVFFLWILGDSLDSQIFPVKPWKGSCVGSAMHSEGSFFSVTQGPGDQRYERGRSTRMVSSGLYLMQSHAAIEVSHQRRQSW